MLDNGILQNNFRVIISPGDGYCLLHSLSLSLKSQFPDSHALSINGLINFLKKEAILHKERYLSAFENNSSNSLLHGLSEYIHNRVYDSVFGDIVPQLLADSLGIDICILYRDGQLWKHTPVMSCRKAKSCVFIFKIAKHYDAVVPVSRNHGVQLISPKPSRVHNDTDGISMSQVNCQRSDSDAGVLRLISWNINGLMQCKYFDDILGKFLRKYDIILLCETWTSADDDITLDGFEFYNFPRPSRHCNAKQNSGGLGVFVRDNIKNHVQFVKNHEDIIECSVCCITTSDYYDTNIPTATDWLQYIKYIWSHADLETIRTVLCDVQSQNHRSALVNAIVSKSSSDHLTGAFDDYINQALERSCATWVTNMAARTRTGPKWYDRELRLKRSLAIKAGETMYNGTGMGGLLTHCREYRFMKQRKQREYRRKCLESIE